MKSCVQIGSLVLALGLAGLLSGCVNQASSAYRAQPANDFEIVETSTKRQLTTRELAYLRAKVAEYLTQKGETGSGDFYVKIYLGEEEGVDKGEWVVVRYTRYPSTRFSMMASYPTTSYPSYPSYSYDYYPFGWYGLSTFSFRYYDDPSYYGYSRYHPQWHHPRYSGHWRDRDRRPDHRDHDRDDDRKDDRLRTDYRPSGGLKPSFVPSAQDRTRWTGTPPAFDARRRGSGADISPRDDSRPNWRERRSNQQPSAPVNHFTPRVPSGFENSRPSTRSVLHRERNPGETDRPVRNEHRPATNSHDVRERVYTPPARVQPPAEARRPEPARQEQRSSNDESSNDRSERSSQPATRSVLHGRAAER